MPGKVLLTGASGYVGGRLLRLLSERSIPVRCLARHPEFLSARVTDTVEVVRGDVLDRESLSAAMAGVETAYYFVHSMGSADDFEEADRRAAQNFAEAAREAGVQAHHLSRWVGRRGEPAFATSPQPPRSWSASPLNGRASDRVPSFDRAWFGQLVVRDDSCPRREAAHHDHATLGCSSRAADRN